MQRFDDCATISGFFEPADTRDSRANACWCECEGNILHAMRIALLLIFSLTVATTLDGRTDDPGRAAGNHVASDQIRPAMILWGAGIAAGLVETITPAMLGDRKTWRITHYPQDPTAQKINDYDLYDLDRTTLAPLRSAMNTEEYHLELIFTEKEVTLHKTTSRDNVTERIPLSTGVEPEGPGTTVFVASLPLTVGYKKRYAIVDRWGGYGSTRVKTVTLSVSERATEDTSLGRRDIYDVLIKPDDGSFQIKAKVLVQNPHYPVRVEYTRDGKTYPASEVSAVVNQMP